MKKSQFGAFFRFKIYTARIAYALTKSTIKMGYTPPSPDNPCPALAVYNNLRPYGLAAPPHRQKMTCLLVIDSGNVD